MRYRIIILPFLDRNHVTITSWDSQLGEASKRVRFWDMGPELTDGELWSILTILAGDVAAEAG
jgi:hypothetical protein